MIINGSCASSAALSLSSNSSLSRLSLNCVATAPVRVRATEFLSLLDLHFKVDVLIEGGIDLVRYECLCHQNVPARKSLRVVSGNLKNEVQPHGFDARRKCDIVDDVDIHSRDTIIPNNRESRRSKKTPYVVIDLLACSLIVLVTNSPYRFANDGIESPFEKIICKVYNISEYGSGLR